MEEIEMTHTNEKLDARNALDLAIAEAQHLAGALNQLLDHLIPAQDDDIDIREPLFAVLDALREKLAAVEKLIDQQGLSQ
jgi:hypothetical protein